MRAPRIDDGDVRLFAGDCREVMAEIPDASIDAVVTDPPYGLEFMGHGWDAPWKEEARAASATVAANRGFGQWCETWLVECLRVLKPGGHLVSFGGTRTFHRLVCAAEDVGFEVRDRLLNLRAPAVEAFAASLTPAQLEAFAALGEAGELAWLYGSGFPKSRNVSKDIDRENGRRFEDRFALGRHIRERREAVGLSRADVNRALGAAKKAEHYESDSPGFARVPSLADWHRLDALLDLDASFLPLVERVEAEREVVGQRTTGIGTGRGAVAIMDDGSRDLTAPATPEARRWHGWGTALKPAHEPILLARKPLERPNVAGQVLATGTGAINVDACRVPVAPGDPVNEASWTSRPSVIRPGTQGFVTSTEDGERRSTAPPEGGRWPANVIVDDTGAAEVNGASGERPPGRPVPGDAASDPMGGSVYGGGLSRQASPGRSDTGGAGRFFPNPTGEDQPSGRSRGVRMGYGGGDAPRVLDGSEGRWPANVVTDEAAAGTLDAAVGETTSKATARGARHGVIYGNGSGPTGPDTVRGHDDTGGPSRFFYSAKTSTAERDGTTHPTVKPRALMAWLVRLVTPPGGLVLDPFAGSGSTLLGARDGGFRAWGIEREEEWLAQAAHRLRQLSLFGGLE